MLLGLAAWTLWGFFPLYWPLLEPAGAVEILAHRIFWSMIVMLGVVLVDCASGPACARRSPTAAPAGCSSLAAVLITVNWGTYIYGVNSHHVVETSLGYFINPLVSVLLGVVVLGERLRRLQWAALALAAVAVLALTVEYGRPPWISLVLAFSFGCYGLAKKKANAGAVESLVVETLVVSPVALGYLVFLTATGASTFGGNGAGHVLLIVGTGVVTVIPLLCFGGAATRIPLSTLGPDAVPHPDRAVPARHPVLPRADARDAVGRVLADLARAGAVHRRDAAAPAPAAAAASDPEETGPPDPRDTRCA